MDKDQVMIILIRVKNETQHTYFVSILSLEYMNYVM